jgi:hypothetical protein
VNPEGGGDIAKAITPGFWNLGSDKQPRRSGDGDRTHCPTGRRGDARAGPAAGEVTAPGDGHSHDFRDTPRAVRG